MGRGQAIVNDLMPQKWTSNGSCQMFPQGEEERKWAFKMNHKLCFSHGPKKGGHRHEQLGACLGASKGMHVGQGLWT